MGIGGMTDRPRPQYKSFLRTRRCKEVRPGSSKCRYNTAWAAPWSDGPKPIEGGTLMKVIPVASMVLSVAFAAAALAAAPSYKLVDRIKVGDGGFEYATFDPATGRVLLARTDYTTVVHPETRKASQTINDAF